MRETFVSNIGPTPGFSENEGTLDRRLDMETEAVGRPFCTRCIKSFGGRDIACQRRRVFADMPITGFAYRGMAVVGFLHHGAKQAGEFG